MPEGKSGNGYEPSFTSQGGKASGAHDFTKDPKSGAPETGGRDFTKEARTEQTSDKESTVDEASVPAGGKLPFSQIDKQGPDGVGTADKAPTPFKNLRSG